MNSTVDPGENTSAGAVRPPWYESRRFAQLALASLAIVLLVEGIFAIGLKENDFQGHVLEGQSLIDGGTRALHWDWYPLGRMVWNAFLAMLTPLGARLLCYLLCIVAGIVTVRMWRELGDRLSPARRGLHSGALFLSLLICFTYVRRDLDECGAQLLLLFLLAAAAHALMRGKSMAGGCWLALAISYKSTPLLFLPVLLWKRQWRACGWALGFLTLFNFGPALWLGWDDTLDYHRRWVARAWEFSSQRDPASHVVEPPKYLNQSLKSALARLVQNYPPGHPLHLDHPGFVQFGNLDVDNSRRAVTLSTLAILAIIGWRLRRMHWGKKVGEADLETEWAALGVLATLLSPFCWKQHLVVALPAVYLVIRHQLLERAACRAAGWRISAGWKWRTVGLCAFAGLTLFTARGLLSRDLAELALSYKVFTLAGLISLALVLTLPAQRSQAVQTIAAPDISSSESCCRRAA